MREAHDNGRGNSHTNSSGGTYKNESKGRAVARIVILGGWLFAVFVVHELMGKGGAESEFQRSCEGRETGEITVMYKASKGAVATCFHGMYLSNSPIAVLIALDVYIAFRSRKFVVLQWS